jgi:microcin C transport system permease protein
LYGLRVSLLFGIGLTLAAACIGIVVGAVQGYYGGWIDLIGQRLFEVWGVTHAVYCDDIGQYV